MLFVKTQAVFVFGRYERDQVFDAGPAGVPFERGKQLTADAPAKKFLIDVQRYVGRNAVCRTFVERIEIPVTEHLIPFRGDIVRINAGDALRPFRKLRRAERFLFKSMAGVFYIIIVNRKALRDIRLADFAYPHEEMPS